MIAECAVEPGVMAEWKHFHSLSGDFSVGQGRLLCEFPAKWRGAVLRIAEELERRGINSSLQAQMIVEAFHQGTFRRALVPSCREYVATGSWCDSAATVEPPFDMVILAKSSGRHNELTAGEFLKHDTRFRRPRQIEVARRADALIDCGWECFRRAEEIVVIDPYFRPREAQFGKVLGRFLERLDVDGRKPRRLEVHLGLPKPYRESIQQGNWNHWAREHLPFGWSLRVAHWDRLETGSKLHARYILTNIGGLDYNWGTDEDPAEHTQVSLLDDEFWEVLYRRYAWLPENMPKDFIKHPERILTVQH